MSNMINNNSLSASSSSHPDDCSICHKVTKVSMVKCGAWLCYDCRKEFLIKQNE